MGDTCWFEMTVAKKDVEKVNEAMFNGDPDYWDEVDNNGTVTLISYEANYGYCDELDRLAETGIVFEGSHGSGGEYEAGLFACCGKKYIAVTAIDSTPVVAVSRNGVNEAGLTRVQEYYVVCDLVEEHFKNQ